MSFEFWMDFDGGLEFLRSFDVGSGELGNGDGL